MRTGYNVLGQSVDMDNSSNASGVYWYDDETIAEMEAAGENTCAPGMRPGVMVIKGLDQPIPTCSGRVYQENLPDVHVVDWRYKMYMQLALLVLVMVMLAAVGFKLFK